LLTRIIARRLAVHMSSTWNQLMDLTIPVVSYFSGFRMNKVLEPLFRGAKIEDCWLPFFCMTLDLVSCVPIVHRNGTLWRYVRASMALVGFLPPLCDWAPREAAGAEGTDPSSPRTSLDGKTAESAARTSMNDRSELPDDTKPTRGRRLSRVGRQEPGKLHVLVDGGYVNNCPTDVMRAMGARVIVAVDVRCVSFYFRICISVDTGNLTDVVFLLFFTQRSRLARVAYETVGRRHQRVHPHRQIVASAVVGRRPVLSHHGGDAVAPAVHHGLRQREKAVANGGRDGAPAGHRRSHPRV
jgi:predicted acylesterase/phospholipase RssA